MSSAQNLILGVLFKVLALTCFTSLSLGFVLLSIKLGALEQFSLMCLSGVLFLLPWVIWTRGRHLVTSSFKIYIVRAALSVVGMVAWIETLKALGPAEATLTAYLTPLFTIFIISITKGERWNFVSIVGSVASFMVIYFTLRPLSSVSYYGLLVSIISAVAWAFYNIICKQQTRNQHFLTQAFYTFLFAAVMTFPFAAKHLVTLPYYTLGMTTLLGILRLMNVVFLFLSLKYAPVNTLMPMSYLKFVLALIGGYLLLGKEPTSKLVIASVVIFIINLYCLGRNTRSSEGTRV